MRTLSFTFALFDWLSELAFLGHALSLGYERLRRDATDILSRLPDTTQRDNEVLAQLTSGFPPFESVQRGFSPNQLTQGSADRHRGALNQLLLFEVCAAFERWVAEASPVISTKLPAAASQALRKHLHARSTTRAIEKALQYPDSAAFVVAELAKVAPKGTPRGLDLLREPYRKAIVRAKGGDAARFRTQVRFRNLLRDHLTVYRAHKELRNCLVHASAQVGKSFEDARVANDALDARAMGLKELPRLIPVADGDPAMVSLRGVFGLMQIVKRTAEIIDGYMN